MQLTHKKKIKLARKLLSNQERKDHVSKWDGKAWRIRKQHRMGIVIFSPASLKKQTNEYKKPVKPSAFSMTAATNLIKRKFINKGAIPQKVI